MFSFMDYSNQMEYACLNYLFFPIFNPLHLLYRLQLFPICCCSWTNFATRCIDSLYSFAEESLVLIMLQLLHLSFLLVSQQSNNQSHLLIQTLSKQIQFRIYLL